MDGFNKILQLIKITDKTKYIVLACCFGLSCYCFLIKLPVPLRRIDTELHALYFFFAAAFLNMQFKVKTLKDNLLIFALPNQIPCNFPFYLFQSCSQILKMMIFFVNRFQ
jgi:hypothetical protein